MRYVSAKKDLVLISPVANVTPPIDDPNPVAVYRFYNGELIVGNPAAGGAGNTIDPTLVQEIYPDAPTAMEKIGLGSLFFEAPHIAASGANLAAGNVYIVIKGEITWNGGVYGERQYFRVNTGDPLTVTETVPDSIIALDISSFPVGEEVYRQYYHDVLQAWYKVANLVQGDEAEWDASKWATRQPGGRNPWTWVR